MQEERPLADAATNERVEEAGRIEGRQLLAMVRLSIRRYLQSRHAWTALALACPFVAIAAIFVAVMSMKADTLFKDPLVLAQTGNWVEQQSSSFALQVFNFGFIGAYLHFGLIFTAILFGNSALREEVDDHTLHYLYLQPAPRWVLILGKYCGFLLLTAPIFLLSMVISQFLLLLPYGVQGFANRLLTIVFWQGFLTQAGVMLLALAIYSAIFLAFSCIFRNLLYALFIYGWEAATNFLPAMLKDFSIAYYLKEMLPKATTSTGAVAVVTDGPGAIQTVLVLCFVWAGSLGFACWIATRKQCLYGGTN